ncbi:hypothetical protein AURDEDRAFT_144787 [Auricularia subglabra TFB-10046 SS5]|nr:hypothetical protein AURDEDRAFT_144787 [Auricularia subglabra TFB-10046 SS5]
MLANLATLLLTAGFASAITWPGMKQIKSRASPTDRLFAHFMIGIESDRTSSSEYDYDMQRAKEYGIDAFALNIGVGFAYESAARNGMKVFISYDFNWWNTGQAVQIGQHLSGYAARPAQLFIGDKAFVSSFAGDGLDVNALKNAANVPVMFVPNFHPGQGNFNIIDGALNWSWPNDGNNKAPKPNSNVTVEAGDQAYLNALAGKPYLAPASPYYGPEVSYSKNWVFPGDLLWFDRWNQLLRLNAQWIELVTWNDYGESHYIGPLNSKHMDDGGSKWVNDMPHNAWLDMAKPYIKAFKARATSVNSYIEQDQIIYWYRPNMRGLNCDTTDTTMQPANNGSGNYFMGRPNGWETMQDNVYIVTLLKSPGQLIVSSGSNVQSFNAPAGAAAFSIPMGVGRQAFALSRNNVNVLAAVSLKDITVTCICGLYNFNAYTGSVPENFVDRAGPDALISLPLGLHVQTCQPTPSLPTSAPPYTGPGGPVTTVSSTSTATSSTNTITTPPDTPTSSSTTTRPPTTTTTTVTTTTPPGTGCTITASEQIRPTNCLQPGCVWQGPPGQATPDRCDGGHRRFRYFN